MIEPGTDRYNKMLTIVAFKYKYDFPFTQEEYDFLAENIITINRNISRNFELLCQNWDLDSSARKELLNYKVDLSKVVISRC